MDSFYISKIAVLSVNYFSFMGILVVEKKNNQNENWKSIPKWIDRSQQMNYYDN